MYVQKNRGATTTPLFSKIRRYETNKPDYKGIKLK